ncbi:uncharacterized protein LOC133752668 [Lepus europaeus]|uniref:uncharacterized protein LOC133752668 n=1 Tax=Lepus europaeus TaxID=9983 RepID=UPI002B47F814|nr:uncharacterized protein LOC133752668 [Lepus europaeus]
MVDCVIKLTQILFISCCFLTVHCVQPNCTSVTDFDDCPGIITDFCPENIACACKDGKPYCKCPNFRGLLGNYWYMGAKCDQLWNTLDLILVAVLPGIGLALIVGVTIQTIYYCKKKSKKNIDDHREQPSSFGLRPQHNSAYAFDTELSPPQLDRGQNPWSSSLQRIFPGSPVSPSSQFSGRNYNFMTHEPKEENFYIHPPRNWDSSQGTARPEANYGNKNSSTMHTKPFYSFSTPGVFPKSSFNQGDRQYFGYPSPEEPEIPYRLGRLQMKSNY